MTHEKKRALRRQARSLAKWLSALVFLLCALYLANWYADGMAVKRANQRVQALYARTTLAPTLQPTASAPQPSPTVSPEPSPVLSTPNADTLVMPLPTAPSIQRSFDQLLQRNPDTVGYLEIGDTISMPVVQRLNDNEYYLSHNFDGERSDAGTLFLDGVNRLYPGDSSLIVYGHNMKNGGMFAKLTLFSNQEYLRNHPIAYFDTIYANGTYVPFAAFHASMQPESEDFFQLRRFSFDEDSFHAFVAEMRARSLVRSPVEVVWGDELLLLVTCSYHEEDARFILALRKMRPEETEEQLAALF